VTPVFETGGEEAAMEQVKTGIAPAIRIAGEGLHAYVVVDATLPAPAVAVLEEALGLAGVKSGIDPSALEKIASGGAGDGPCLVASGSPSAKGADGRVEWLFSPGPETRALYRNAAIGQRLARVHPPLPGVPGTSVLGQVIPAPPGKPARLHTGPNTATDPSDPAVVVATAGGNIVAAEGSIEVQPVLTVAHQIDYGSGDIDFAGSIIVRGDIRGDVTIKVKGSLTVHGNIEDAVILAGGDVTVEKGFVGRGKGRIEAGGCVKLLHVLNQTVIAGKDVLIGRESVNGTVTATGCINAPAAMIAGGVLRADGDIVVNTIGSTDGLQAKVHAGKRGRILERLPVVERDIKQAEGQVGEIKEAIYKLVRMQIDAGGLDAGKKEALRKLQIAQKMLPERIAALKAETLSLKESLKKNQEVTVTVHETVFEHTMVDINGSKKMVDAALQGVIFRERNGAIEVSSC
jgi:uncharacterized protein